MVVRDAVPISLPRSNRGEGETKREVKREIGGGEREREREREIVCVCVYERDRQTDRQTKSLVCVCVCVCRARGARYRHAGSLGGTGDGEFWVSKGFSLV